MAYDLTFLFFHPYAAASFVRERNELVLTHSSINDLNADAPEIQHEQIHVELWLKLRRHEPSPFYGSLDGDAFAPDTLNLDEMEAYYHDLNHALQRLYEFLSHIQDPASVLTGARMKEILEGRFAGNPPLADLNPFEQVWDGAAKKIVHGMWHTEPVIDALTAIGAALQEGGHGTFTSSGDQVIGDFAAKVYEKAFTAHINLVQSPSAADPSNSESFKAQVAWSRNTATERAVRINLGGSFFRCTESSIQMTSA